MLRLRAAVSSVMLVHDWLPILERRVCVKERRRRQREREGEREREKENGVRKMEGERKLRTKGDGKKGPAKRGEKRKRGLHCL